MSYQVLFDENGILRVRIGFDGYILAEAFEAGKHPAMSRESRVWILNRISTMRNA